jgi:protein gp37
VASVSRIEWTDATWNPITGCTPVSEGCAHCYAERMARRLKAMGCVRYANGFALTLHHDLLDLPLGWRKPRMVFVNSMSDLFHQQVPLSFVQAVFDTMAAARQHVFQVLTKRADRLAELAGVLPWPGNVWVGVTVESPDHLGRLDRLREVPAAVRFVSAEPLLGALGHPELAGIDWAIAGGESGPGARPMSPAWATELRDHCVSNGVPFFFKQWGGSAHGAKERHLEGRLWSEMPHPRRTRRLEARRVAVAAC